MRALAGQIIAWEGVTDEADQALTLTPDALDAFAAHPLAGPVFARAYDAMVKPLLAQGNASANSLSGDTAVGIDTAPDAPPVAPVDAATALPSATPRKAQKG